MGTTVEPDQEEQRGRPPQPVPRRLPALLCVPLVLAGIVVTALVLRPAPAATTDIPPQTERVKRTSLVQTETVDGILGHGDTTALYGHLAGTVTALPTEGSTVRRGQPLYAVEGRPVVLMYGTVAAYRPLRRGVEGADVAAFERNLDQLGYGGFAVDDRYTGRTAEAVERWQDDLGLDETGVVEQGRVVLLPGPVRVDNVAAAVGQPVQRGAVMLHHTATERSVAVDLDVDLVHLAKPGSQVTVSVPGRPDVTGEVASVGTTVRDEDGDGPGSGRNGGGAPITTRNAQPTVAVIVSIADQQALGAISGAPVRVALVAERRDKVLAVPLTALLGLREGGYGVEVVDGSTTRVVAVQIGLFASGMVEVSGGGVTEGTMVGVAPR